MKNIIYLLLAAVLFVACKKNDNGYIRTETMYVASEKRIASIGIALVPVYVVKYKPEEKWDFFYDEIEGFKWEKGYEYEIVVSSYKVDITGMADAPPVRYVLDRVVSKVKKDSVGLPNNVTGEDPRVVEP